MYNVPPPGWGPPRPPPHPFASVFPPRHPLMPPPLHWDPTVPPHRLRFPPGPYPPRELLPPGARPPLALPPPLRPFPLGPAHPRRGLPPGMFPPHPPGVTRPPRVLQPRSNPPLLPGMIPRPRGLPPGAIPPPPSTRIRAPVMPPHPMSGFFEHGGMPPTLLNAGFASSNMNSSTAEWKRNGSAHWSNKRKVTQSFSKQPKQKRQKVDRRDLPENNVFVCETCDRGFKTEELYRTHLNSHEKCPVSGCQFAAHPKIVRLHYECQHRSGLAKKIWQLESKEDIARWIADRKKNYPTNANVERKRNAREDKLRRGEVIENKFFGKFQRRGRGCQRHFLRQNNDRWRIQAEKENRESAKQESDVLGTFCLNGVGDESKRPSSSAGDVSEDKLSASEQTELKTNGNYSRPENYPLTRTPSKNRKRHTLLEQLLVNEIRHERNILLQCVRYVVDRFRLNDLPSTDEKEKAPSSTETLSEANAMKSEALETCIQSDVCFANAVINASCVNAVVDDDDDADGGGGGGGGGADAVVLGEELMTGVF